MDAYQAAEVAYKNGYEKGYEKGKEEFADKLASIILQKKEATTKARETYSKDDEGGFAYWLGRGTTYAEVLTLILELREGIGEDKDV